MTAFDRAEVLYIAWALPVLATLIAGLLSL